jgi:hypothetical protein
MKFFHELSHIGFLKSYLSAKQKYYWPGMCQDFKLFVESCLICQQTKSYAARHHFPLTSNPVNPNPFETVHIDHHQMPIQYHGFKYVFIMTDPATGNVELAASKGTGAQESAELLFNSWICRYGLMKRLYSDRHASFLSQLMTSLVKLGVGGKSVFTSGHRAQCNASAELICKQIIQYVRSYAQPNDNWCRMLPAISCANKYLVNTTLGVSPFFAMHGVNMRLNLDMQLLANPENLDARHAVIHFSSELDTIRKIIAQNRTDVREATEQRCNKDAIPHTFTEGMRVFLKAFQTPKQGNLKHSRQFIGPYLILDVKGPLCRLMHIYTAKILPHYTNVDQLRPLKDSRDILYNRTKPTLTDTAGSQPTTSTISLLSDMTEDNSRQQILSMTTTPLSLTDTSECYEDMPLDLSQHAQDLQQLKPTDKSKDDTLPSTVDRNIPVDLSRSSPPLIEQTDETISTRQQDSMYDQITRLSAVRPKQPFAMYKAHIRGQSHPVWISAEHIAPELIIEFNLARYRKKLSKQT